MTAILGAVIGVFGAILGTVIGHFLSERAAKNRESRLEEKQVRSVRTLISIEIDHNLSLLKKFWKKISSEGIDEQDQERKKRILAGRLIESPIPAWSEAMWESQAPLLANALNAEEISGTHEHHAGLLAIRTIQQTLSVWDSNDRKIDIANQISGPGGGAQSALAGVASHSYMVSNEFPRNAPSLWVEFETIVQSLIKKGNPIQ